VPCLTGTALVQAVPICFRWHAGMSASQKRKNVAALHDAADQRGFHRILEISTKSDMEIGRRLSAFHQKLRIEDRDASLESVYHASKVFECGGPYIELMDKSPRDAKQDERLKSSGKLVMFELEGKRYPLTPATVFYDWLYVRAISVARDWLRRLSQVDGFSDIEFNPEKSVNCQARSCAAFVSMEQRGLLDCALESFQDFYMIYLEHDVGAV